MTFFGSHCEPFYTLYVYRCDSLPRQARDINVGNVTFKKDGVLCCSIVSEEHAASGGKEMSGFEALRERADALRATIVQVRRRNALSDKTINELSAVCFCFNILTRATHSLPRQARDKRNGKLNKTPQHTMVLPRQARDVKTQQNTPCRATLRSCSQRRSMTHWSRCCRRHSPCRR
jgi:hypothetical protein